VAGVSNSCQREKVKSTLKCLQPLIISWRKMRGAIFSKRNQLEIIRDDTYLKLHHAGEPST
jgi:hypothetical protein